MGFAAVALVAGFVLTRLQDEFGWSDGVALGLLGGVVLVLLLLADRIEGRPPHTGPLSGS